MSRTTQERLESLVPQIPADGANPFAENLRHPATPVPLEAVDTGERFSEQPVSTLCPGCSQVLTRYRDGLPLHLAQYEAECERCATSLQRWAVVAIGSAYEQAPAPSVLRETVTQYWEEHLWSGIVTGETSPRTAEYSRLYTQQADSFGWDWDVTCPLCRTAVPELDAQRLDYHHWCRAPDQGICLCRVCHDAINGQRTDDELDWRAQRLGFRDKYDLQLTRLALREQAVVGHESLRTLAESLHTRYNLIQTPAHIYALLSQTLADQTVLEGVSDEHLLAGLDR